MYIVQLNDALPNGSPAAVDRQSGTILLSDSFKNFSDPEKDFIIFHEIGHYVKNTRDQYEADEFAADNLVSKYGLTKTFKALNNSLVGSHDRRINLFDYLLKKQNMKNLNPNYTMLSNGDYVAIDNEPLLSDDGFCFYNDYLSPNDLEIVDENAEEFIAFCEYYNIPVCADNIEFYNEEKKAARQARQQARQDRKNQRAQAKIDKQNAKNDLIQARADAKRDKAAARLTLADQGIVDTSGIGGFLGGVKNTLGGIFGGGSSTDVAATDEVYTSDTISAGSDTTNGGSKKWLFVGLAIVVVIAIVIFFVMKKKK